MLEEEETKILEQRNREEATRAEWVHAKNMAEFAEMKNNPRSAKNPKAEPKEAQRGRKRKHADDYERKEAARRRQSLQGTKVGQK